MPDQAPDNRIETLRSFYALEQAKDPMLDNPDAKMANGMKIGDYRTSIEALRAGGELPGPGIDSFRTWEDALKEGRLGIPPARTTSTTTSTTEPMLRAGTAGGLAAGDYNANAIGGGGEGELRVPPPGTPLRGSAGIGRAIGRTVGGGGGALLPFPVNVAAAPILADLLGRGGEQGQAYVEQLLGQRPSVAGTPAERYQTAGGSTIDNLLEAALAGTSSAATPLENLGNALVRRSPSGRVAQVVADQTAARQAVREGAPVARSIAEREINAATGAAQRQAAAAESAMPGSLRARSDVLNQQPVPGPVTSPILAPVGRGLNAEPIVTEPNLTPLTAKDVTRGVADPRRVLEQVAGGAENTNAILKAVRDKQGDIATVRLLLSRPDTAERLVAAAQTDREKTLLDAFMTGGKTLAGAKAAMAKAEAPSGVTNLFLRGLEATILNHAVPGYGAAAGLLNPPKLVEKTASRLLDSFVNAKVVRGAGRGLVEAVRTSPVVTAPAAALLSRGNQQEAPNDLGAFAPQQYGAQIPQPAAMTLAAQRILFTRLLGRLIVWADEHGLAIALDQVKRTQLEADANAASGLGIRHSLHLDGLAADFIAYILKGGDWVPLLEGTEPDYALLGQQWETMHELACWGGRFGKPDPDHFSLTRGGIK